MKYLLLLIGVFFAFVLGYLMEPGLRGTLVPTAHPPGPEPPAVEETVKPEPEPVPESVPESVPDPDPEVVPDVPDVPEVEEVEEVELPAPTDDEIRQIMSDSIEQAEIQHFGLNQVTEWKEFGEEEIDGETYHFGRIDYVEETSLGERTIEAKALIRHRKVEKWIWTRSGMRIE